MTGSTSRCALSAWRATPIGRHITSASVSVGGSRSRPCCRWTPTCSCSTSRRRISIRPRDRELADILGGLDITIVLVTHDLPYALQLCTRSVVLDHGRVVSDDDTSAILGNESLLSAHRLELPFGFDERLLDGV